GPKLAVTALGGMNAPDLAAAIRAGSLEQLTKIPGVGKKTAERLVLELRDKLDMLPTSGKPGAVASTAGAFSQVEEDVISALANFGATRAAAEAAVTKGKSASESNDFDALFRRSLKLVR
ncbi:MAG: Holliday junction branch migration protein RuvA, partial [Acidobacteriota bacterium]